MANMQQQKDKNSLMSMTEQCEQYIIKLMRKHTHTHTHEHRQNRSGHEMLQVQRCDKMIYVTFYVYTEK